MGIVKHQCPHCGIDQMALQVVQAKLIGKKAPGSRRLSTLMFCQSCEMPIAAILKGASDIYLIPDLFDSNAMRVVTEPKEAGMIGLDVDVMWPQIPKPRVPEHLDLRVVTPLLQAERAFHRGDADAAVMMYGRTLELALKITFAGSGTLNQRIRSLIANHTLPQSIGDWATEVRLIRNEAAHDDEPMGREDMVAIRNFTDAFLRYAITLPKEVELRRAETAPKDDAAPPQLPPPAA